LFPLNFLKSISFVQEIRYGLDSARPEKLTDPVFIRRRWGSLIPKAFIKTAVLWGTSISISMNY